MRDGNLNSCRALTGIIKSLTSGRKSYRSKASHLLVYNGTAQRNRTDLAFMCNSGSLPQGAAVELHDGFCLRDCCNPVAEHKQSCQYTLQVPCYRASSSRNDRRCGGLPGLGRPLTLAWKCGTSSALEMLASLVLSLAHIGRDAVRQQS